MIASRRSRLAVILTGSMAFGVAAVMTGALGAAPALATGPLTGSYYIDNSAASNCSDSYSTTSPASPWCDFANLQGQAFAAGASILLRSGDTWDQELGQLSGSGTAASPITITSYGTGANPRIQRDDQASDRGIWIENGDYWSLSDLEVSDAGAGIVFYYTTNGHQGLSLSNIYVHNMTGIVSGSPSQSDLPGVYHSPGIFITGQVPVTASTYTVTGVTMTGITGYQNRDDIDISGFDPGGDLGFLNTSLGSHTVDDLTITNSYLHDAYAGSNFDNLTHLRIVSSIFDSNIQAYQAVGTTQVFLWSDNDVATINSVIRNGPDTGSPDQTGSDLEAYDNAIRFHGDYIGGNAGAGIEVLGLSGRSGDASTNQDVSDNVFDHNDMTGPSTSSIWLYDASGDSMTGSASDNLYYEPSGLYSVAAGSPAWTFTGNQAVSESSLYSAGNQYSSAQGGSGWGYQSSSDGTNWSNLTYDSGSSLWGSTSDGVGQFDLYPPASSSAWVARTWTAPAAGAIDIRGWVVKNQLGGNGVNVRITDNGTAVFSTTTLSGTDQDGFATNVDNLAVSAGDVIRFAVSPVSGSTDGVTSWAPGIGYVPAVTVVPNTATGTGSEQFSYASGTWGSNSDVHYNTSTSGTDYYTIQFTGQQIVIHGGYNNNHGIAAYSICDATGGNCGPETAVDTYAPSSILDQAIYTSPLQTYGTYTLKVRNTGTADSSSSGNYIDVGAAIIN